MDLGQAGMLAGGSIHARSPLLGFMWAAALPMEQSTGHPHHTIPGQNHFQRTREDQERNRAIKRPLSNPGEEPEEEEKPEPDLVQLMVRQSPIESQFQGKQNDRETQRRAWADARFQWGPEWNFSDETRRPQTESKERYAHERHAENGPGSKPKTRTMKGRKELKNDLKLHNNQKWILEAKEKLRKKLFSSATTATKNAKRRKLKEIMTSCGIDSLGSHGISCDDLLTVAAVLGEKDMKSADQYLGELKLMQLEMGVSWPDTMDRQLSMLKRALRRDTGPEKRAKEVKIQDIPTDIWEAQELKGGIPRRVAWSFVWATLWMLRSAEAAELNLTDLTFNTTAKTVSLLIRKSKMDQKAKGVRRTLKCCQNSPCVKLCPWQLALRIRADHITTHDNTPLFPDPLGSKVPKVKLIKSWMDLLDQELTGHSARRSGAMYYARNGLALQEIAMLGRWKSSAVFRYVEEALEDIPLDQNLHSSKPETSETTIATTPLNLFSPTKPQDEALDPNVQEGKNPPKRVHTAPVKISPQVPEQVWVVSTSRKSRMGHRVREASWNLPLWQWTTWCGWHFADRNVKVAMTTKLQQGISRCKKCEMAKKSRDDVKGGVNLAQLISLEDEPTSTGKRLEKGQIQPSPKESDAELLLQEGGRVRKWPKIVWKGFWIKRDSHLFRLFGCINMWHDTTRHDMPWHSIHPSTFFSFFHEDGSQDFAWPGFATIFSFVVGDSWVGVSIQQHNIAIANFFWQLHAYKPPQLSQSKAVIFRQDVPHAQFDSIIQVWGVLFLFGLLVLLLFLLMFLLLFLSFFVLLVLLVLLVLVVIVLVLSFSLWEPIVKRPAKGVRSRHGLIHTKHHAQVHKFNMSDANMQQQVWDRKQSHFPRHFIMRCARYKFPRFKPVISMPSSMMPSSTEKGSLFSSSSSKPQRKTRDGFTMLGGKGSRASTAIWSDGIQGPNTSRIFFSSWSHWCSFWYVWAPPLHNGAFILVIYVKHLAQDKGQFAMFALDNHEVHGNTNHLKSRGHIVSPMGCVHRHQTLQRQPRDVSSCQSQTTRTGTWTMRTKAKSPGQFAYKMSTDISCTECPKALMADPLFAISISEIIRRSEWEFKARILRRSFPQPCHTFFFFLTKHVGRDQKHFKFVPSTDPRLALLGPFSHDPSYRKTQSLTHLKLKQLASMQVDSHVPRVWQIDIPLVQPNLGSAVHIYMVLVWQPYVSERCHTRGWYVCTPEPGFGRTSGMTKRHTSCTSESLS